MQQPGREKSKKEKFIEGLTEFLQKNRVLFLSALIAVALFFIIFAIVNEVRNKRIEISTEVVEELQGEYETWLQQYIEQKNSDSDEIGLEEIENEIISQGEGILKKFPKLYAAQRVHFILGNLAFEKEDWTIASEHYLALWNSFPESYLAPISLNNAAVSIEQTGDIQGAISLYNTVLNKYSSVFPDIPRILFTLGRLHEQQKDYEEAEEMYNVLINEHTASNWTNLARDRIIYLQING